MLGASYVVRGEYGGCVASQTPFAKGGIPRKSRVLLDGARSEHETRPQREKRDVEPKRNQKADKARIYS